MQRDGIIKRFTARHGNRYDYSLVPYGDTKVVEKVSIVCPEHGTFEQEIRSHYQGNGCIKCSSCNPGTITSFIEKSEKVHGKRYDYSKAVYLGAREKLEIVCREHGPFWAAPTNHHRGKGCPKCGDIKAGRKRKSKARSVFETRSRTIHGDKYDYSNVKYDGSSEPVRIICPEHGEFRKAPYRHLRGEGCPRCAIIKGAQRRAKSTREERKQDFIRLARELHGDKYDYSLVDYNYSKDVVRIICPEHGVFEQRATSHVDTSRGGKGCPTCGLKREYPNGYVYVLYGEGKTKIGITYDPKERFRKLRERTPFPFEPVGYWFCSTYDLTFKVESVLHRHFEEYSSGLKGFDGAKEWFDMPPFEVCDLLTNFLGAAVE